jgi:TPR repeat protein
LHHLALLCNRDGDAAEFRRLLSAAADAGNPDSLFLRGHCRYFGTDGHDRDAAAAMDDFLGAAEGGNADAMVSAGALLHRGLRGGDGMSVVVERDQRRAFELYQRAGELGSAEGWRNVVSCYATGQGVPKCMDTARHIANTMLRGDDGS